MGQANKTPTGTDISAAFHKMMESHTGDLNVNYRFMDVKSMLDHVYYDFQADNIKLSRYNDAQMADAVQAYVDKVGLDPAWLEWMPGIVSDMLDRRAARPGAERTDDEEADEDAESVVAADRARGDGEAVETKGEEGESAAGEAEPEPIIPEAISTPVDIHINENWWDNMPPLPVQPVMDLAQTIKSKPKAFDNIFEAIHDLYIVCFVAKAMTILENTNEGFADFGYVEVGEAVDAFVEKESLPQYWHYTLFYPACAAVRALKAGKTLWYRPAPEEAAS